MQAKVKTQSKSESTAKDLSKRVIQHNQLIRVHRRAPYTHMCTLRGKLVLAKPQSVIVLGDGRKPRNLEETQLDIIVNLGSNLGLWSCEAAKLPPEPLRQPD